MKKLFMLMFLAVVLTVPAALRAEEIVDGDALIKTSDDAYRALRDFEGRQVKFTIIPFDIYLEDDGRPASQMDNRDFDHPLFFTCRFDPAQNMEKVLEALVLKQETAVTGTVKNNEFSFEMENCLLK